MRFNEHQLQHIRSDLEGWGGVSASDTQIEAILDLVDPLVLEELSDPYYSRPPNHGYGLDTMERDYLFDAVAEYVGGTHWPLNMEHNTEYGKGFPNLLLSAIENEKLKALS